MFTKLKLSSLEPVIRATSATYFKEPHLLIDRLLQLITISQSMSQTVDTIDLSRFCFSTILEASIHSNAVWTCFEEKATNAQFLKGLLLESQYEMLREGVALAIRGVCRILPSFVNPSGLYACV